MIIRIVCASVDIIGLQTYTCNVILFQLKKQLGDNEAVTQEIVGSAHLENYALKMFLYADNEDRAGRFHK